jgi:hypothetical protein
MIYEYNHHEQDICIANKVNRASLLKAGYDLEQVGSVGRIGSFERAVMHCPLANRLNEIESNGGVVVSVMFISDTKHAGKIYKIIVRK